MHYIFIPVDSEQQWEDLADTWVRVILGIVISISLGKILVYQPSVGKWIYFAYVFLIVITVFLILNEIFLQKISNFAICRYF
jgi:membrane protein YdbS with pleckstrin-like domain